MCNAVEEYAKEEGAKIIIEFCLEFSLTKGEILEKYKKSLILRLQRQKSTRKILKSKRWACM